MHLRSDGATSAGEAPCQTAFKYVVTSEACRADADSGGEEGGEDAEGAGIHASRKPPTPPVELGVGMNSRSKWDCTSAATSANTSRNSPCAHDTNVRRQSNQHSTAQQSHAHACAYSLISSALTGERDAQALVRMAHRGITDVPQRLRELPYQRVLYGDVTFPSGMPTACSARRLLDLQTRQTHVHSCSGASGRGSEHVAEVCFLDMAKDG